ncbi:hypothetical protein [Woeseia oceani]|uniref:DUF5640 domain-containing protein n=1 Tax=Woeseia oceani TaxID=1548547 RepID=A0A193LD31_9GAMM|nr:hypothetical protein [Woeseia oceani]ANO50435.1 hypothetical protein BA177_03725 [Woeseia oceani]
MRALLLCPMLLLLAACEPDIAGVWTEETGLSTYEFLDDGQLRITVLGTTVAARYRVDGEQVLVSSPQGTVVLDIHDNELRGPMGLALVRNAP